MISRVLILPEAFIRRAGVQNQRYTMAKTDMEYRYNLQLGGIRPWTLRLLSTAGGPRSTSRKRHRHAGQCTRLSASLCLGRHNRSSFSALCQPRELVRLPLLNLEHHLLQMQRSPSLMLVHFVRQKTIFNARLLESKQSPRFQYWDHQFQMFKTDPIRELCSTTIAPASAVLYDWFQCTPYILFRWQNPTVR